MNASRCFLHKSINASIVRFYSKTTPSEYCLNLVRRHDYESFLCTLLLSSEIRSAAFAIRAFNTEVALVRDQVSDVKIGLMRLKFWEEALNSIYEKKSPQNPTCLELQRVLQNKKLSKNYFKRLIKARFDQLYDSRFVTLKSMEEYTDNTNSCVYFLILEAQKITDVHTDHYASHLGKAQGITNLIRSIPHNSQRRCLVLPEDVLIKHNVSAESIFQAKREKNFKDAIFETASIAKQHLDKAAAIKNQIRKEAKRIFLPRILVANYLEKLRRVDFDVFDPSLQKRDNLLPLRLYWNKLFC